MTDITLTSAAAKTASFRSDYPGLPSSFHCTQSELAAILQQSGCNGVRFYFTVDNPSDATTLQIVVVGTHNGDDLTAGLLKNTVSMCPPVCGEANELNGL